MTARDGFTPLLDTWLREEGTPVKPDYLDEILSRTATTRQRPAWRNIERWLPFEATRIGRLYPVAPVVRYVALAALLVVLIVAALVVVGSQRRLPPPFGPAANGLVAFDSDGSIVVVNTNGTDRQELDLGLLSSSGPVFSPDGTRFAFYVFDPVNLVDAGPGGAPSFTDGALWVADAEGTNAHAVSGVLPLTVYPSDSPSWSPDGTQLAFNAEIAGLDRVFIASADGSGARILGDLAWRDLEYPAWSPSGRWIAFAGYPLGYGATSLIVVRPDGTDQRVLHEASGSDNVIQDAMWAPDLSDRLAYAIGGDNDSRIAVVDVDTGKESVIVDRPGIFHTGLSWSPDAKRIASNQSEVGSVVVNADGTNLRVLERARCAGRVTWSPDGTRLLCLNSVALADGVYELLVVDADGEEPPTRIVLDGEAIGQAGAAFSWQRLAP